MYEKWFPEKGNKTLCLILTLWGVPSVWLVFKAHVNTCQSIIGRWQSVTSHTKGSCNTHHQLFLSQGNVQASPKHGNKMPVYTSFSVLCSVSHIVECASLSKYTPLAMSAERRVGTCTLSSGLCFQALKSLTHALLYVHHQHGHKKWATCRQYIPKYTLGITHIT